MAATASSDVYWKNVQTGFGTGSSEDSALPAAHSSRLAALHGILGMKACELASHASTLPSSRTCELDSLLAATRAVENEPSQSLPDLYTQSRVADHKRKLPIR